MVQKCLSENDFREGVRALLIEKVCDFEYLIFIFKSTITVISNALFRIFFYTLMLIQRTISPNGDLLGLKTFVLQISMIISRT